MPFRNPRTMPLNLLLKMKSATKAKKISPEKLINTLSAANTKYNASKPATNTRKGFLSKSFIT